MPNPPRAWRSILLAAIVALLLVATLRPFNFRFDPEFTSMRIGRVDWAALPSVEHESLFIDVASNVLLFFPYGVAVIVHRRGKGGVPSSLLLAALSAACLSSLCETLQVWLPTRYPQLLDVETNTLGALLGAVVAAAWDRIDRMTSPGEVRNGFRWSPAAAVLTGLAALLLLHPFFGLDPVRSVKELESHAKAFIRSPLFDHRPLENGVLPLLLLGALSCSVAEWVMTSFPSLRAPFGYVPALLLASPFVFLLPIARIFSRSFSPDWGTLLFGFLGISLGTALHRWRLFR